MTVHSAKITIINRLPEIRCVADMVDAFCARHAVPQRLVHEMQVVLDEVLSNVIRHAFTDDAEHEIRVALELSGGDLLAVVEDDGIAFDPTRARVDKLTAERARRGEGGLGITFVRALCDRISYRREATGNSLCVAKRIQSAGSPAERTSSLNMSDVRHGETSVLSVSGRLDTANAHAMKTRLEELIGAGARQLAVDLSLVTYISSAGFWALLFAANLAERAGGGLVVCGLRDDLAQLVERAGLAQILRVAASREAALHALHASPKD
ncbi:MAG: anti-sigma factor antagonist [Betaproteobacteria bacterium]|nr:anti-sigma factor antagonist [Betaproteobacteria bacterium]